MHNSVVLSVQFIWLSLVANDPELLWLLWSAWWCAKLQFHPSLVSKIYMYDKPFHSRLVPNVGDGRVQVIEYYTEKHKVTTLEANAPTSEVSRQIERALGFWATEVKKYLRCWSFLIAPITCCQKPADIESLDRVGLIRQLKINISWISSVPLCHCFLSY